MDALRSADEFGIARNAREGVRRKHGVRLLVPIAVAAAASAVITWGVLHGSQGDVGSAVYPLGDRTLEQAQEILDERTRKSRIMVSLQPEPRLADGRMGLNFIVDQDNNGWSERIEVEQEGRIVYKSGIVKPGNGIVWAESPSARPGPAVATIYAVDAQGKDHGNPVSVEIGLRTDE